MYIPYPSYRITIYPDSSLTDINLSSLNGRSTQELPHSIIQTLFIPPERLLLYTSISNILT